MIQTVSKKPYLVFTSAGDFSNLHYWLDGERDFDLYIVDYGEQDHGYAALAEYYLPQKGGKFPNLYHVYQTQKELIESYKYVMVMDDDVIIDSQGINQLFKLSAEKDLWLVQPAFESKGVIRHKITRQQPFVFLRYTNFVEMTCPIFRADKLRDFLSVYDPILVGWGVTNWVLDVMGKDMQGHVAIVDGISCINPRSRKGSPVREILKLQSDAERYKHWIMIRDKYGIKSQDWGELTYSNEGRVPFGNSLKIILLNGIYRMYDRAAFFLRYGLDIAYEKWHKIR